MNTKQKTKQPALLELIDTRWSPRAFKPGVQLTETEIDLLFEAARWAPSSYNAQPWRYIYAIQGSNSFYKMLSCLSPTNQIWAKYASLLIISYTEKYLPNRAQNRFYMYDCGAANYALTLQALSMGYHVHQMGGFNRDKTKDLFVPSEDLDINCFIAVGKLGELQMLTPELRKRETSKKGRRPVSEFVYEI